MARHCNLRTTLVIDICILGCDHFCYNNCRYMQDTQQQNSSARLQRTKAALLAVGLAFAGVLLIMANSWMSGLHLGAWAWLQSLPFVELGGILFGAGLLSTLFEYTFRRDQERATEQQFRQIIREQAPTMRDAVINGFAIHPEDLKRVANPELLDDIATNVMAIRLGDEQFARELYTDIRDQAIRSPERWYDVNVGARLSTAVERSTGGTPLFDLTVEWEYTTIPSHAVRRFACVSDREEYNELIREDTPATAAWFMRRRDDVDPSSRENYELLEFAVDGEPQRIHRSARKNGQIYSVRLSDSDAARSIRIRQIFRTVTPTFGHRLFFELPQPARNLSLTMDYTNTAIAEMRVSDTVATARPARVSRTPSGAPGREIQVEADGWLLPKNGFAFTWTLETELPRTDEGRRAA